MKAEWMVGFVIAVAAAAVSVGCVQNNGRQESSTVTVSGVGTVSVVPDMVRMTVSMSKTERTTRLAQVAIAGMTGQVLGILKEAGIEDKDISTASLTFNPEYEWRNSRNVLVGQRAEQRIEFAVRDIHEDSEKVPGVIDRLAGIDGIMLGSIDFSVADNTENFVRSRELAFEKAKQKAEQYASLSGLRVGRVLSLSEDGTSNPVPLYRSAAVNQFKMEALSEQADVATVLPSGRMEVTTRISVAFTLE